MAWSCGCKIQAGQTVSVEEARAHFKHTYEAIFVWEIMMRREVDLSEMKAKLSQARADLLSAIEELFPEVKEE
jgi:UDP-glucose 4-epimerase